MKRVTGLDLQAINSLFLNTQPAHLQRSVGKPLDGDARKAARAEFVRARIGKNNL
jgi:protein arginine kinase